MGHAYCIRELVMRRIPAQFDSSMSPGVHRVVDLEQLALEWTPHLFFLVQADSDEGGEVVRKLRTRGLHNICWSSGKAFEVGDIVVRDTRTGDGVILFRESDVHHSLLLTNRCN